MIAYSRLGQSEAASVPIPHPAEFAVTTVGSCVVLWWRTGVVMEGANAARQAFKRTVERYPSKKVTFLTLIEGKADIKTPGPVRRAIATLLSDYDRHIGAAAIVYEATGFEATVARSIITAINLASRGSFRNRVFSDTVAACTWLSTEQNDGTNLAPANLLRTVQELRASAPLTEPSRSS